MNDVATTTRSCPRLRESYHEIHHPCGLTILCSYQDFSTYHAILGVRYGAADRPIGRSLPLGVAHFLEHKMFAREGGSFDDDFAALGADVNAYTTYDRTAYLFSTTTRPQEALGLLLSMVKSLCVDAASVSRERDIIAEEIRMNADDPWERCYAELLQALYVRHPMREEICGSLSSIRRITPRILRETHAAFYRPDNMVLAVSGRILPEDVVAVVDEVFGREAPPASPLPLLREVPEPDCVATPLVSREMDTAKPLFAIGAKLPAPPVGAEALLRCDVTMSVLSEMLFSHAGDFYGDLFERGVISPGMAYSTSLGKGYGCFSILGECDDPDLVFEAFCRFVDKTRTEGLQRSDFERVRRILYADYVSGFDSPEDVASSLFDYATDSLFDPHPIGVYDYLTTIESLTFEDVAALFERVFRPEQYARSVIYPFGDPMETGKEISS